MAMRGEISSYGFFKLFLKTVKNEGPFALYKGILPSFFGIMTYKGFGFAFYESIYMANSKLPISDFYLNFFSGAISVVLGQLSKRLKKSKSKFLQNFKI